MAVGVDGSPAGAVDVLPVVVRRRGATALGFEDRDANSLSLDLHDGDATV
jgi:hypothetical protein